MSLIGLVIGVIVVLMYFPISSWPGACSERACTKAPRIVLDEAMLTAAVARATDWRHAAA